MAAGLKWAKTVARRAAALRGHELGEFCTVARGVAEASCVTCAEPLLLCVSGRRYGLAELTMCRMPR